MNSGHERSLGAYEALRAKRAPARCSSSAGSSRSDKVVASSTSDAVCIFMATLARARPIENAGTYPTATE